MSTPTHETERVERVRPNPSSAAESYTNLEHTLELPCWLRDDLEPEDPSRVKPYQFVILHKGEAVCRQVFLCDDLMIGRHVDCQLRLENPTVSRVHARFEGGFLIDNGSSNGTFVNGERTVRCELTPGDVVRIADYELIYQPAAPLTLSSPSIPSQSFSSPVVGVESIHLALGQTLRLNPAAESTQKERSVKRRGYLQVSGAAERVRPRACQFVVDRDTFLIGSDPACDLRLQGWWIPALVAVIVRGASGFTLDPVGGWLAKVELCGHVVRRSLPLEDQDTIRVVGQTLVFRC